jgi:hypothetical protein
VQLAGPLSFGGGSLILVSLCAFPAAQRAWGTLAVTRRGLLLPVAVALLIPCTRFAVASSTSAQQPATIGALAWQLLYAAMLLKAVAGCFAFTGTMIIVTTSLAHTAVTVAVARAQGVITRCILLVCCALLGPCRAEGAKQVQGHHCPCFMP